VFSETAAVTKSESPRHTARTCMVSPRCADERGTSFGATAPPFIDYLKDILRRYPDGGQILKVGVMFCQKMFYFYEGPALYAYNNAAFTEDDWGGIQMAGRSVKRDDPNKVGRFGIGFNSVYHITDVPSIFSSGHLGMMDPQEKVFGERNGGFQWSLDDAEDQEVLLNMRDQFQPFRDIVSHVCEHGWSKVVMEDQHFNGTIFRFPLRNEASEISDNLYDSDKVVELFDSFIADADLSLLFLKSVTSVSLLHISEDGAVNTRLEVKSSVPTDGVLEPEEESVTEGLTRFKVITVSSKDQKETKWLLTTCTMKEGVAEDLDLLTKKLSFLPQVDLAFPCGEKRDCSQSRLSCFLPLPNNESNKTGLPVYVNACFGLTDNRRHIKWQEEDQRHDEHALWNEMLMKKVFPQAYIKIIQGAIKLAQKSILPVSSVYNLWPDLTQIQHKEKWHALTLDVFHHLFRQNMAILSLAKDERQFVSPSEAVFPCNGPTSTNILSAIKRALVSCGENLVTLPASVARAINEVYPNPTTLKHVTPAFLRAILHRIGVDNITKDDKLSLLEYILGDEQYKELEGLHLLPLSDDFQHLVTELKSASHTAREELKDYLSYLDSLSKTEKDFLLKLPLFQTMKGFSVAAQSKQAVLLISGLTLPTELPMPDSIIQCSTETDRRLLQLLKVHLLDTAEAANVLVDSIRKGACSSDNTNKTMTWILQHGKVLFSQNESLKCSCKDLSFIEVNGQLKKASDFFDPRIQTFKVIFESDFFPPPSYTHSLQMLESLTEIGLLNKEMDVSPEHLLHAATLTDKLCVNSQTEDLRRAQVLLEMVESNGLLSRFSHRQLHCLKMLKWIPCEQPGTDQNFSDKSQKYCLFCPNEIRHSVYKDIVGHVMPLTGKLSDRVSNSLGLKDLPPPEKVIENLTVLKSKALEMVNPDTDVDFKRQLHSIYKHMQDNVSVFVTMMDNETCWLWTHNQFVAPQDLVLEYPNNLDLSSYIGKVPKEFLPYRTLFQKFGLRTVLSNEDILGILYSIQETIEARQPPFASSSEVKVSIEILNWLWKEKKTVEDDIPVPVIAGGGKFTLKPRSTALFCDVSKNGLKELNCREEEIYVIHEEIPKAAAEWLGIRFLSTHILDPEEIGIEQCGQSEPITMRIKNILKEYDEDSDIFKELIQNAEDAGADVCKFLVDFRVHIDAPESLIDPDMALCQGPCLWAFNNEQFTAEDWKNIVRVGSASKENKVEKIGKFGLGFNTVYHVTDVPSILSGNTLLILDPNVTHLTKHIKHKSNPGIKLDLSQQQLFHCFPGQFGSYENIFDCNFTRKSPPEPYPGTLIKLPFRSEEEAVKSEISTNVYQKPNILDFQHLFSKNSQTHLLFLKNIITLSLQNIPHNGSTPPRENEIETIFSVSKTTVSAMEIPDDTSVSQQRHAEKSLMKLDGKCKGLIESCTVRIIQISSQQSNETKLQFWLLYNCFGTDESFKMAIHKNKQASFSLPIGGIAVPLQNHPETGKFSTLQTDLVGQAFCFLPLPIHTGLPVNVNGTFAVTSNRKGLWETGVKNDWNKALLQDPVVTAYVTVLKALKKMSENKQLVSYCYHTFWPDREKVTETFKPLVDALYSTIVDDSVGPELFSDGEQWLSMNNVIFLHESIENDEKIGDLAVQVCQKYAKGPNHVVPLPVWLRNSFKQAGLEKVLQNRTWNWEKFYREAVFSNLTTMDSKSRDTLVLHAIDLHIKEIDNLLLCYPCIPTKGGQLQHVRNLVNPTGKVACLFESKEGRLLDGSENDFRSPKRIQRLLELGMANDHLPLEDITEKAGTINKTWSIDKKKAFVHLKCLFELMKNHIYDIESHHWKTLRTTGFLPAYSPGDAKMEGNVTLKRPTDVFSDKCSLLVNMTQPVLDNSNLKIHHSDPVLKILGVNSTPKPEVVLQQLHEGSKQAHSIDRSMLYKIAFECYKCLDQWICDSGNATYISQQASSFPFILIGDTFVNVDRVAENGQFEAKPYLHVLPAAFTSFRNLWTCIGVEKQFTITQFLTVLQELQAQHGNQPLPKSDLSVVFTILNKGIFEVKVKITDDCLIPNEHGVLQFASELFYNDSPWMPLTSGVTLCHENIPRAMARHLGIKTTRHHSLETHIVDDMSPFAFDFEQQEQLTVRIKNIISAYPSKKDILKELIQNADDAEATEIHFIWDKRQHGKEKTFGKKWNNLQGPALCVFNNKVFSDADIKGIQQLGEGGKHSIPGKIGKYGVGFNSVYHLTDCPSILTGDEVLCISDPNQKYIENHSNNQRYGIGYKLADTFKEMYVDVYKSFLPDKFSLKEGTMFRLPLRMGTNAKTSKISQQGVTDRDMKELCSALSKDPEGLILFLKNICKIKVHEISEDSRGLKTIFEVEKNLPQKSREEKDAFVKHLQNALQSDKLATQKTFYETTISTPHKIFYETVISTSDKRQSKWIVAEQFGSFKDSFELKLSDKIPQASLAARVNTKGSGIMDFKGEAFCSLPLPGKTGLPVHVNGNFEVDSARRSLWKEDGKSKKSDWNEILKQNVIAPLYADLLHYIRRSIAVKKVSVASTELCFRTEYLCFWPTVSEDVCPDWHEMIHEVYRSLKEKGLDVIPVMKSSTRKIADKKIKEYSFDCLTLSEVRKLFSDCYILPVLCPRLNNRHFLQTMKHISSVVFASEKHKDISGILFKLGFMSLDHVFFSKMDREVRSCLQHELLDVDDQSSVLDQVYNINHPEFSQLSNYDMKEFQMFLQSGLSKSKDNQEYVTKLKSLPIFETTHGERVRIDGPKKVYVLNIEYSVMFPDLLNLPNSNSIFLKFNSENHILSETLNIQVLDDLQYFMKFILPAVHQLTETQIFHSLKLLLSLHYFSEDKKTIISSLKTVKLIRSSQGRLEPASYYFDESVELYKHMLPQEKFVPERFWTELCEGNDYTTKKAKDLVRELGMKHVVSNDEIKNFAYQLESEAKGKGRLEDLKLKSSLLFRKALNKAYDAKDDKERLLESIADIKFLFPVNIRKELSIYHQPFAPEGTTVKIRGSLIEKNPEHQDLIWTSIPIIQLPGYTTQKLIQMMKNAGAHEEPPPNCVASNIRNICQSPCETDQLIKTRAKVFRSSYAYLQAKRFAGNQLPGLPVVLVEKDTKLMRPDDVCLSLLCDLDFRPYLYKITPEDAMYAPFFQKIGVKNEATVEQYCNVLAAVYADSCDKQKLHSNQLRTVKRAVEQLFKLISAQGNETLLENVETLYLPAVDGKLYPSSTLCYNDTVFETKRLEEALENKFLLLEKLSECHLGYDKYKHHQLLQLLPQKLQPKMLSEFTEERVVESKMQLCELGTGCEFSGWFDKHLSSGTFKYGLICLIRENSQGKITQEDASNICEQTFGSIQIICCKTLETALWLDNQPLPKTDEETDVSVERGQQGCTFYLKHNDDIAPKVITEVIMTLTKEINVLLANRIASVHLPVLGLLLMCDYLQDVRKTLAKNRIRDSAETESSSFSPAAPGTEIPEEWHDCLDMNVLNNFEEGEYVGYSIGDKYIYAVIDEELPGHNGQYSWRYKVDIGQDEPIEVSCVDLFQFKREKKVKPEENTCMELEPLTGAVPNSSESSTNSLPASVEEAKREIDKCLAEIWRLPEEERHKAIKRLYLRWHPDKNPDCQSLANEAFKYIQNRIDELSKGKAAGSTFSSRNTNFRGFYQQWNQEARYHRNSRERFSRGYRGFHSYNFWTHNENVPRPDREEARRWCRQARCDLNAAHKDTGGGSTEWCLFKVHQAVEKSLIAACYKRNGQRPKSSSISATAAQVSCYSLQLRDLPEIVKNLQTLGVDPKRTQYPNCHPYPHIPNGRFRSENEMLALNKASELLNKIEAYVN
uniref:HEPN domain-containing protein n=1 Tax=Neolamprologus brichardi TaxID=32507 RepID=A0A3Q4HXN2_NEOBR